MATHAINDLAGKYVGPLAMVLLLDPAQAVGIDLTNLREGSWPGAALLVYGAVVNTLVVNLFVWPLLAWAIVRSRRPARTSDVTPGKPT